MIRVLKLIIAVALATLVGIWATKYHGYIMIVVADKTIKINLVACIFIIAIFIFILIALTRVVNLIIKLPYLLFSWFIGLFRVDKQERFVDLIADIMLENDRLIKKFSIGYIIKLVPKYLQDYIIFKKLNVIASTQGIKELDNALKSIDANSTAYKFFEVYKLYLVQKFSKAQEKISFMLDKSDQRFMPNIVNLAAKIVIEEGDDEFAIKLLEKYDVYLTEELEENLVILALTSTKDINKLDNIYNKSDMTKTLSRVYLDQLINIGEIAKAEKFAKKQLANNNISSEMLKIYINALNIPIAKICDKVLSRDNDDYSSIITLLNFAMLKSDNYCFKRINEYIDRYLKDSLSEYELERYNHILCKFFIKNGEVPGLDLSVANLVYANK
ncbi:MAG: membrane protein [Francisella sp.]